MEDIRQYEITRTFFNKNRWFVAFRMPFNGKKIMARAIYVWLLGNPQFEYVPPGYCIHHLDLDQLNDDISNLALMKTNHHMAYHLKYNNKEYEKVKLKSPVKLGIKPSIPKVSLVPGCEKTPLWRFRWQEIDYSGKCVSRQITRIKNNPFRTEEEAEKAKNLFIKLHPHFRKADIAKIENLIYQISAEVTPEEMEDAYPLIKENFPTV